MEENREIDSAMRTIKFRGFRRYRSLLNPNHEIILNYQDIYKLDSNPDPEALQRNLKMHTLYGGIYIYENMEDYDELVIFFNGIIAGKYDLPKKHTKSPKFLIGG